MPHLRNIIYNIEKTDIVDNTTTGSNCGIILLSKNVPSLKIINRKDLLSRKSSEITIKQIVEWVQWSGWKSSSGQLQKNIDLVCMSVVNET